jgi:uncharacterized protein with HEPN domain
MRSVRLSLSSSPRQCLVDILENIGHIEGFLKDMGPLEIHKDQKTIFACQYALLVISEAAKRLGPEGERLCPGMPWRDIRGIGNQLRHAYDNLNAMMIWKVYQDDLPVLKAAVTQALAKLGQPELPSLE